ncbi:MAG: hypothetical protein OEY17_01370 [Nitrosopumilus sp.]|nr:hypothetical protein [Nitrosopumilus sp.]
MKKGPAIGIVASISVAMVLGIIFAVSDESEKMEVEDVLDREIMPDDEVTPEVQAKLDEIEKINLENEYSPKPREWITSGPFQIDRSEYVLGEKIFLVIGGLQYNEKGQIAFLRPLNDTHYEVYQTIPFDGAKKNAFNYYIQPQISKIRGICSPDDITGNWNVVFRGTSYPNLEFKITDEILPGEEDSYKSVC